MKFNNFMILEFPSKSSNEAFARSAVACFAAQMDPTLEELGDIRTAVSEAVTNCIVHAYPNELVIITNFVTITNPDIEQAKRPMFTTGGTDRSGMGFTIMESFMTSFELSSEPGKGTTVHMRRKINRRK